MRAIVQNVTPLARVRGWHNDAMQPGRDVMSTMAQGAGRVVQPSGGTTGAVIAMPPGRTTGRFTAAERLPAAYKGAAPATEG